MGMGNEGVRGGPLVTRRSWGGGPQVAAAEAVGAVGVLLYPDPQDTAGPGGAPGLGGDTAVTVHVSEGGVIRGQGGVNGGDIGGYWGDIGGYGGHWRAMEVIAGIGGTWGGSFWINWGGIEGRGGGTWRGYGGIWGG